ncbi:MAG: ester cyclase [Pseudomonadota bacterium]
MRIRWFLIFAAAGVLCAPLQAQSDAARIERNKALALEFYEQLWNTNNTDRYSELIADEYVIHDIGDDKGIVEPAIKQQEIADFFWSNGTMTVEIDYQLAERDIVATRWIWRFSPESLFGRVMLGVTEIPIINVFRFNDDGKIVEIWNHRHDIDTSMTLRFVIKGFVYGVLVMLIVLLLLRSRWKKKLKIISAASVSST